VCGWAARERERGRLDKGTCRVEEGPERTSEHVTPTARHHGGRDFFFPHNF
jgi:hypothetical protein